MGRKGSRVNIDLQKCQAGPEDRKEQKEIDAYFTLTLKKFKGTWHQSGTGVEAS